MAFIKGQMPPVGRQFKKGESGNPRGRSKAWREVAAAARDYGDESLTTMAAIMRDKSAPPSVRLAAAVEIQNRAYGKPMVNIEMHRRELDAQEAKKHSDDELYRIIAEDTEATNGSGNGTAVASEDEALADGVG